MKNWQKKSTKSISAKITPKSRFQYNPRNLKIVEKIKKNAQIKIQVPCSKSKIAEKIEKIHPPQKKRPNQDLDTLRKNPKLLKKSRKTIPTKNSFSNEDFTTLIEKIESRRKTRENPPQPKKLYVNAF